MATLHEVIAKLRLMEDDVTDTRKMYRRMGNELRAEWRLKFASSDSGRWEPLSRNTDRIENMNRGQLLVDTRRLRNSWVQSKKRGNITRITPLKAEFGSSVPYATFHETGTKHMPKRSVMRDTAREIDAGRVVLDVSMEAWN